MRLPGRGRREAARPGTVAFEPPAEAEAEAGAELARLVGVASRREDTSVRQRAAALGEITALLAARARSAGLRSAGIGRWTTDLVIDLAPHLSVRDAATLRRHYPGLTDDEIAGRIIVNSARTTAAVGAAAGALAAVEFAAPPTLLAAPVQIDDGLANGI